MDRGPFPEWHEGVLSLGSHLAPGSLPALGEMLVSMGGGWLGL